MAKLIHLTREDIKFITQETPVGFLVPEFIGQQCLTNGNKVFFANGMTNQDWIESSGSCDADDAIEELAQQLNNTNVTLQETVEQLNSTDATVNEIAEQLREINNQRLRGIEIANSMLGKL